MTPKERIQAIEQAQKRLQRQVQSAQEALYKLLLESLDKIEQNPAYIEQVWQAYSRSQGVKLVTLIAKDVATISSYNYRYFLSYKDELNLNGKDFARIKSGVDDFIKKRIGISGNKVVPNSFLDTVLQDTTVKQKVKQQAYTRLMSGEGATSFRKGMKDLVLGTEGKLGALEGHYNTFVYDTYNQVDSAIQEQYSTELGMTAFVYEGGLIKTSRAFCKARNGKVILKEEALKEWDDELKTAKPADYKPLIHRGGFNCRHAINYVSDRRAMRMRADLEMKDGKLVVKQ